MLKTYSMAKLFVGLLLAVTLTACGGGGSSDSSFDSDIILATGETYQCSTESASNSCSATIGRDCSACTCNVGCDSAPAPAACAVNGNNVTVPNGGSCTHNGATAECSNGVVNYNGISSQSISLNGTVLACGT